MIYQSHLNDAWQMGSEAKAADPTKPQFETLLDAMMIDWHEAFGRSMNFTKNDVRALRIAYAKGYLNEQLS